MTESHPIPELAKTAIGLLVANFNREMNALGHQTREVMGLPADPNWLVDFDAGTISRPAPDKPVAPALVESSTAGELQ